MNIFQKLHGLLPSNQRHQRFITLDPDGFSLKHSDSGICRIDWISVNEIVVFKHDLYSIDEICLGFRCDEEDRYWWVGEEDCGFEKLQNEFEQHFDGLLENWRRSVAFPVFEENWTSIWKRGQKGG